VSGPAGVVLAAGAGERVRPLSLLRPKPLFPVAGHDGRVTTLLDLALEALGTAVGEGPGRLAVNAHHLAEQVVTHVGGRAHVEVEQPVALGTAGALGGLRGWVDGRDVLLLNGDVLLDGPAVAQLLDGWDGDRSRLLVVPAGRRRVDFEDDRGRWRYVGACLLPGAAVAGLPATPSGLYEVLWRDEERERGLDLVPFDGVAIDCGTPADYLEAALRRAPGGVLVEPGADVLGTLERAVVWAGARVGPDEHLVDAVRAGAVADPVTVDVAAGTGGDRPAT
jgi:MurNAc alpha-1-phosphate uridylyltransferase